jgi:hypothetical protein
MVNPVHRVHARWTGAGRAVHRGPTVARIEGTAARSPELDLRPLRCGKARRRGAQKGERSMGSSARASPELGWCCSDRATALQNREAAALGERDA